MKNLISFIVILSMLIGLQITSFSYPDNSYIDNKPFYKFSSNAPTWKQFKSTEERRKALYIEDEFFDNIPTEEVLRAVLEYPFIEDLLFFNDNKSAIKTVSSHCTALRVFLSREDSYKVLEEALSDVNKTSQRLHAPKIQKNGVPYVLKELKKYFDNKINKNFQIKNKI